MFVVVMTFAVHMLVGMFAGLMAMLMTIVGMSHGLVRMLVFMFVFVVAAHFVSPPVIFLCLYYNFSLLQCQ
jgi:hypothetical protein